jgi:hypothetical protein
MIPGQWTELAEFQLHIAERWRERGARAEDSFARFFFYFAGINALYFLWSKVDDIRRTTPDRPPDELLQIRHLLSKAGSGAGDVLTASGCVEYFAERRPIERMDKRSSSRASVGDRSEGRKARDKLGAGSDPDRLGALGVILYLVRSNLVHGNKMDQGDDEEVIRKAAPGLAAILDWAVGHTRSRLETQ